MRKLIVLIVIFTMLLSVSAYSMRNIGKKGKGGRMAGPPKYEDRIEKFENRIIKELYLTENQIEELKPVFQKYKVKFIKNREKMVEFKKAIHEELQKEEKDYKKIKDIKNKETDLWIDLIKLKDELIEEINPKLNDDQKVLLKYLKKKQNRRQRKMKGMDNREHGGPPPSPPDD